MSSSPLLADDTLDSLFTLSIKGSTIRTEYRYTVHDLSPEWGQILLIGFSYASSFATPRDTLETVIREQDGRYHLYSTSANNFYDFINDKISLNEFLRTIRMKYK